MRNEKWHDIIRLALGVVTCGVMPALGAIESFPTGQWDDGATRSSGVVPGGTNDVVIKSGHTVTINANTTNYVHSLIIETNGILTHTANSTTALGERYKVVLDVAADLTIDLGGAIDVTGKGYAREQGPGRPRGVYGSGGYGGMGGYHSSQPPYPGPTYGSISAPTNCGSGGRGMSASQAGPGGARSFSASAATPRSMAISAPTMAPKPVASITPDPGGRFS